MVLSFINIAQTSPSVFNTSLGILRMLMNGKSYLIPIIFTKTLVCMLTLDGHAVFHKVGHSDLYITVLMNARNKMYKHSENITSEIFSLHRIKKVGQSDQVF